MFFERVAHNRGRNTAGVDGVTVRKILSIGVESFLEEIRTELRSRRFQPSPPSFHIQQRLNKFVGATNHCGSKDRAGRGRPRGSRPDESVRKLPRLVVVSVRESEARHETVMKSRFEPEGVVENFRRTATERKATDMPVFEFWVVKRRRCLGVHPMLSKVAPLALIYENKSLMP